MAIHSTPSKQIHAQRRRSGVNDMTKSRYRHQNDVFEHVFGGWDCHSQQTVTCSKSTIETLEKIVKYVQRH